MATLSAVVLSLVDIDVTTARYNCKVHVFPICFLCAHDLIVGRDPKVETFFELVSKLLRLISEEGCMSLCLLSRLLDF
jgi:hypothetical protein